MENNAIKLKISGMTCGNCAHHVTEELKAVEGVDRVSVILKPEDLSTVDIFVSKEIPDAALREAVDEAGDYEVAEIQRYGN
ncbi:heavy-metal-associated domain-containing protein [Arcanobacterium hippocoleae]